MGRPETGRTGARFGAPARRARADDGAEPPPDPDPVADPVAPEETGAGPDPDPGIGLTGARFGGRARPSRRERQAAKERAERERAGPGRADVGIATTGGPGTAGDDHPTVEMPRTPGDDAVAATVAPRPYVLTGGRTRVRAELRIETLVCALEPPAGEVGEHRTVLALCERPRSVGEVAALTGVPLGVARVLIDDLATAGRVRIHLGVDAASGPDAALLERVLAGLRRL